MWHEGSHSSDVYWFRAKLEWGKGGQEEELLGGSTDPPPKLLDMFKKFNATHASAFGSA